MLRTIGQVWPPATAKVAAAGSLPASTKKAKMQVLRMVHPDKVRVMRLSDIDRRCCLKCFESTLVKWWYAWR
jgi:hypothetical protein